MVELNVRTRFILQNNERDLFMQNYKMKKTCMKRERACMFTQLEGTSKGAGAAKTGWFLMRVGGETEELSLAKVGGRNVSLLRADEVEVRHQPLIEAVDIAQGIIEFTRFIPSFITIFPG